MSNWYKMAQIEKKLKIMRSPAGAGKSTLAKELGQNGIVLSSDDFFMKDGKYVFDATKLKQAHDWNKSRAEKSMTNGISPIVIDNTNTKFFECAPYVRLAQQYGYEVEFVQPNWHPDLYTPEGKWNIDFLKGRNKHGVPDSVVENMANRFEYDPTIEKVLKSKAPWEK